MQTTMALTKAQRRQKVERLRKGVESKKWDDERHIARFIMIVEIPAMDLCRPWPCERQCISYTVWRGFGHCLRGA